MRGAWLDAGSASAANAAVSLRGICCHGDPDPRFRRQIARTSSRRVRIRAAAAAAAA